MPTKSPIGEPTPVQVEDSVPIQVETQSPLAVTVENPEVLEPADPRILAAQRMHKINRLWEYTQAFLAISLTMATIYAALVTRQAESETLKNALFVVLGFYFGRTNHSRPTPTDPEGVGISRQKEVK